jgi:hypothetical protein
VVGANTGRDGQLQVLGLGQTLRGEVAGVEAGERVSEILLRVCAG